MRGLALALAAGWCALAAPASAIPVEIGAAAGLGAGGAVGSTPKCGAGVTAVNADGTVRSDDFVNDRLVRSVRTTDTLKFDVTGWGLFSGTGDAKHSTLRLNTVTADGRPRQVTLERKGTKAKVGRVVTYANRGFSPRLYADGYTYYAYTINGSALRRWNLVREADGTIRYARSIKLRTGLGELTSLQATTVPKVHGVPSELLYATTKQGGLVQLVVPLQHPQAIKIRRLLSSGLEGVTELSWSICNHDDTYHTFVAIDPADNRATWVTVKNSVERPRATVRGPMTGVADWNVTASY